MNHFGLSARRLGSLPLSARNVYVPFRHSSQQLFSFRESFSRRLAVVFSRREERLCSLLLSKSTTFFPFRETLFHRGTSRFLQSRGAFMLPLASGVNRFFFVSAKFHFACVSVNRFPSSRGTFMLHPAPQVNHFFSFHQNYLRKQQLFM